MKDRQSREEGLYAPLGATKLQLKNTECKGVSQVIGHIKLTYFITFFGKRAKLNKIQAYVT